MNIIQKTRNANIVDIERAAYETKLEMINSLNIQLGLCKMVFAGDEERENAFVRGITKATIAELVMSIALSTNDLNGSDLEEYYKEMEKFYEDNRFESLSEKVKDAIKKVIDEDTKIPKPDKYRGMGRRN